jgi:hypothetical protein
MIARTEGQNNPTNAVRAALHQQRVCAARLCRSPSESLGRLLLAPDQLGAGDVLIGLRAEP